MKSTLNPNATAWVPKEPIKVQLPPGELPFVVVLIGPPGVGKTTQGLALQKLCHFEFLCIDDKLHEMRQVDPTLDANWSVKYCASMANNLLEEYVRKVKDERTPGLVIEYVKTPDGAVIVEETCKRHGLKVNCTLLFNIEDILVLTSRIKGKDNGRRADMNPQYLLNKIHEYMFVEKAFHSHYHNTPGFRVLDASKPLSQVTEEVLDIITQLKGPSPTSTPTEDSDVSAAPAMNFVPPIAPFLQFVNQKAEVMLLLSSIQNFIGLNINRDRRFPGSSTMTLDEAGLKNICATDHRYVVSKKISGLRYLFVHLKGDGARPGGCYLVDRAFAVFRIQPFPPATDWGDMLLDGCLTVSQEKGTFIVFDCLYFDGIRTIPETLDSRLEYVLRRFPMETALSQQLSKTPTNGCAVVCKQYYHIRDLPRLLREFETPDPQALYQTDGLIFTPKKNGYRTSFDPHLFKWKPMERCTVDFRLNENRQGGHDLLLARPVGKELREMPYDFLDSSVELPAALVGSVVECRPLQKPDSMGLMRTTWQILSIRSDKNTPDREDVATACLQNNLSSQRLLMLYHQFSQPQPEVFPPPVTQAGVISHLDPSMGRYSPTLGMPIYVGSQLPQGVMPMGPPAGVFAPPAMPRSDLIHPTPVPHMPGPMYGPMMPGPMMGGLHHPLMGPGLPNPQLFPPPPPPQQPLGRPYPVTTSADQVNGLAPGILSSVPMHTRPMMQPMGVLPTVPTNLTPMAIPIPHAPSALGPLPPTSVSPPEGFAVTAPRDLAVNLDSAVVQYAHGPGVSTSPPMDTAVVTVGPPMDVPEKETQFSTPSRERRASDGQLSAEPSTPPAQQYTVSAMAHLSLTSDPKENRRVGDWPFFQTPQVQRAPFGSLDLDSHEDRNHTLLRMKAFDPAEKENTPARSNAQEPGALDKAFGMNKSRSSPQLLGPVSPAAHLSLSPGSRRDSFGHRHSTYSEFAAAAKEWLLRKFVPRPSAAKPRPFNAVDMAVGRGFDLPRWDKAHCSYLVGISPNPANVEECRSKMSGRDSEMEADFLCMDIHSESFALPLALQTIKFEVVGMFFCLEQAFQSEQKARQAIANAASLLKKGGHLLILTTDEEVIQSRVKTHGRRFENSLFRFTLHGDVKQLTQGIGCGVEYTLEYEDAPAHRTYVVPRGILHAMCHSEGLDPLPQDHGMFNFEDIASYIEKSVSKGHLWRDLPQDDRDLATFWCSAVFQKGA